MTQNDFFLSGLWRDPRLRSGASVPEQSQSGFLGDREGLSSQPPSSEVPESQLPCLISGGWFRWVSPRCPPPPLATVCSESVGLSMTLHGGARHPSCPHGCSVSRGGPHTVRGCAHESVGGPGREPCSPAPSPLPLEEGIPAPRSPRLRWSPTSLRASGQGLCSE